MPDFTQKAKAAQEPTAAKQANTGQASSEQSREAYPVLHLQHTTGNQAVLRGADQGHLPLGPGEALAGTMRGRMESILGTRLGNVGIHRGPEAERAAAAVGAPAFTVGQDIILGADADDMTAQASQSAQRAAPPRGERLLAHEAAHTVQHRIP